MLVLGIYDDLYYVSTVEYNKYVYKLHIINSWLSGNGVAKCDHISASQIRWLEIEAKVKATCSLSY